MDQNTGVTEAISRYITTEKYENIPAKAREKTKEAITDFVGVALAGNREEICRVLLDYIKFIGGEPQARIIGSGYQTSVTNAALVNGAIGHALDFDDWSVCIYGHPTVVLAPCILALSEFFGLSGKDLICAYVAGYEVYAAIPWVVKNAHYNQGWHVTGTWGTIGAAAAAANLLKLSVRETQIALGLASSMASGVKSNYGTMTKPFHAGNAAANGLAAAYLAKQGFTASQGIFDVEFDILKAFGYNDKVDWGPLLPMLGQEYKLIGDEGINIKPYPACGGTAFGIDAVKKLLLNYEFHLEDIAEIELWVNPLAGLPLIHHNPSKGLEGKFSLEYTVARALISKHVTLQHFTDEAVNEPAIKELIGKMRWLEKYPMPKGGASDEFDPKGVLLRLKDGRELFEEVFIHTGMPKNPMPK